MATLYMNVWASAQDVAQGPVLQSDSVAIAGSSDDLNPIVQNKVVPRHRIRLFTDADCFVAFGVNPTADSTGIPMAANQTEYFELSSGENVAVIERV